MTPDFKLRPKLLVIVDLAIENDPDRMVLIGKWLCSCSKIDDAEPTMSQPNASCLRSWLNIFSKDHDPLLPRSLQVEALTIRPPMSEHLTHVFQAIQPHLTRGITVPFTGDPAHSIAPERVRPLPCARLPVPVPTASTRARSCMLGERHLAAHHSMYPRSWSRCFTSAKPSSGSSSGVVGRFPSKRS